jgi:hypothetical protein
MLSASSGIGYGYFMGNFEAVIAGFGMKGCDGLATDGCSMKMKPS